MAKNNQILDDEDYNMEVQYSKLSKQSAILSGNGFLLANSFSQSQPSWIEQFHPPPIKTETSTNAINGHFYSARRVVYPTVRRDCTLLGRASIIL